LPLKDEPNEPEDEPNEPKVRLSKLEEKEQLQKKPGSWKQKIFICSSLLGLGAFYFLSVKTQMEVYL